MKLETTDHLRTKRHAIANLNTDRRWRSTRNHDCDKETLRCESYADDIGWTFVLCIGKPSNIDVYLEGL
ncbi:hypothetical protein [Burkholderia multivorans]|uniref:hypothetical protein n=1 Tax=Burkholderia multivorans TaxID=87883 RepID=UPI0021C135FC|nr:hypothetical protein [Burkholderia multivorans]